MANQVNNLFTILSKEYDFNFDVDKVVGFELVYSHYPNIKRPIQYIVGRHTISPDDLLMQW